MSTWNAGAMLLWKVPGSLAGNAMQSTVNVTLVSAFLLQARP